MSDLEDPWLDPPAVVAPTYLRWSLVRGRRTTNEVAWVLREWNQAAWVLGVPQLPTEGDLVRAIQPMAGRPIAEALVEEAVRRLPGMIAPGE